MKTLNDFLNEQLIVEASSITASTVMNFISVLGDAYNSLKSDDSILTNEGDINLYSKTVRVKLFNKLSKDNLFAKRIKELAKNANDFSSLVEKIGIFVEENLGSKNNWVGRFSQNHLSLNYSEEQKRKCVEKVNNALKSESSYDDGYIQISDINNVIEDNGVVTYTDPDSNKTYTLENDWIIIRKTHADSDPIVVCMFISKEDLHKKVPGYATPDYVWFSQMYGNQFYFNCSSIKVQNWLKLDEKHKLFSYRQEE